jgi:hypothetical protein
MLLFVLLGVAIFNMKIINSKIVDMTQHRYPEISLANSITTKSLDMAGKSVMPSYSVPTIPRSIWQRPTSWTRAWMKTWPRSSRCFPLQKANPCLPS